MGVSEKLHSVMDSQEWVISAGISLRTSLKPVFTKPTDAEEDLPTTPTHAGSRIPTRLPCPPAPRKRKQPPPASSCHYGGVRKFFNPPDLDSIFIRRVDGA